jgi:preprotein translocase subunit YajC
VGTALAQTGGGEGPPGIYNLLPFLLIGIVFYVLLLRPEQRKRREHQQMLTNLKRNDPIVLASGIHGRVAALTDKIVTVEIAPKVQVQVDRSAIQAVQRPATPEVREKEREKP